MKAVRFQYVKDRVMSEIHTGDRQEHATVRRILIPACIGGHKGRDQKKKLGGQHMMVGNHLLNDRACKPVQFKTGRDQTRRQFSDLSERIEFLRLDAGRRIEDLKKAEFGQFLTPAPIARLMASMLEYPQPDIHILDAGAGVGSLFGGVVAELCHRRRQPDSISVTAYEIDPILSSYLSEVLEFCKKECERASIQFTGEVFQKDFIRSAVELIHDSLFPTSMRRSFNCAIQNPPYRKISSKSEHRELLRLLGIETSNLYTGFLATTILLLEPGGELVAITPRSFFNGSYFKSFRKTFLESMTIRRIHIFESRHEAFSDENVLQENVIIHAIKGAKPANVVITSNTGPSDEFVSSKEVSYEQVVRPDDPEYFIHIIRDDLAQSVVEQMKRFETSLAQIGIEVSTGRVVDFRAKDYLRSKPEKGTAPLIFPTHIKDGLIKWPKEGKKPNAIMMTVATQELLVPNEHYVLVKRFSAKEEKKRLVAAVCDPARLPGRAVAFENHLNYYHCNGRGLPPQIAKGLAAFLNSSLVDSFFRQFSGHTQVNATDLRNMKYPTRVELEELGSKVGPGFPTQDEVDELLKKELLNMPIPNGVDPVRARKRIEEAFEMLKYLGLPREQQNERSALTLLALLGLRPDTPWSEAHNPLCGITPMMNFFAEHYGKTYKPNTRESVRRQTVHQFLQAGLIVANPDNPKRPVNSPKAVYHIEPRALALMRTFRTKGWDARLRKYITNVDTLRRRYAREREMSRIPITITPDKTITLSPGGQNVLIKVVVEEFASRFTSGGRLLYVGDTGQKFSYIDKKGLAKMGIAIDEHGKMPDVIIHHTEKNWLVLVEAVTSHGPVTPKRREELEKIFKDARAGVVYVTAFETRKTMVKYLNDISWDTEVWVAESPSHLIHFNGERFLGPYPQDTV